LGCWIEVRPLRTLKGGALDVMRGILDVLHNSKKPFRFVAAGLPDEEMEAKYVVRFYFEFPDEDAKRYFTRLFTNSLDVEVHEIVPPKITFEKCAELEMARHFAHPIIRHESSLMPPLDGICSALADGGAFEVVAVGDIGAKTAVHQFVYDRMHGKPSFSKAVVDAAFDVYAEASIQRDIKDVSREAWWSYRRYRDDKWVQKEVADAERKMHENLFTCEIRLYGDGVRIEDMKQALPSGMNRFKVFRTLRNAAFPFPLKKPRRILLRNILSPLWLILPAVTVGSAWYLGVLDPFRLGTADLAILLGAAVMAAVLAFLLRRKNPIVLSTSEISLMVGLPSNLGRIPVKFGTSAYSTKPILTIKEEDIESQSDMAEERMGYVARTDGMDEEDFVPAVKIEELASEEPVEAEDGLEEKGLEEEGVEE